MHRREVSLAGLWLAAAGPAWSARRRSAGGESSAPAYGRRPDVLEAAGTLAQTHDLDADWVATVLAQARYVPAVAQLMMPPTSLRARNWAAYRARFVEKRRVDAGRTWWDSNADALDDAQLRYGVPAEIVVGIVGVETFYGRMTGNFRVLDALATLSFDFPKGRSDRSAFFRSELGHYLVLSRREAWEPAGIKGSYAGAMGLPQFMPSSLINYGIDADGDGRVDLFASASDVVGSVANYLMQHGWHRGMATHFSVEAPVATIDRATLLVPDIVPSFSAQQMVERGAALPEAALAHDGSLALIELLNGEAAPSYVAGTQNFYAITRYNASSYYAMAVIELGRAVVAARN